MEPQETPSDIAPPDKTFEKTALMEADQRADLRPRRPEHFFSTTPVFIESDSFYRSRTPTSTHWSIAWSDLMMTMFILFLTLFVYQIAHRDLLKEIKPEVIAGHAMEVPYAKKNSVPFYPISPTISSKKGVVLKKLEGENTLSSTEKKPLEETDQDKKKTAAVDLKVEVSPPPQDKIPAEAETPQKKEQLITKIFDLSKYTLASEKLEKFASVELIPDKTMRIILTGDLLFESGKAELSETARESLQKLAVVIKKTPYMINVVGHTDSVPMHSANFPTNWELSVARASRVARFLIEDVGIPGNQIQVSGYGYFRPVKPNDTEENRKANRRVEIILSKEPPQAEQTGTININ